MQPGVLRESMENFSNSASMFRSVPCLAIFAAYLLQTRPASSGLLSCVITARSSRQWTFLPCQPRHFESCIASLSSSTDKVLHFNVTEHPSSSWIVQQLREAFPEPCPYRYAVLDRDAKFSKDVADLLVSSEIKPKRTSFRSPWQNGIAERWIGSCRQELLDHVVVLNEAHLRRLMRDYLSYYHEDRIHDSLEKDSPSTRPVSHKPDSSANLISLPRIGGLHHRYDWQRVA